MITIHTKKHDNFSVEFKFGFVGNPSAGKHQFVVNTWIFVPNSVDVNPQTYGKDQFYRDIKSNVRLITPVFLLREIADTATLPFTNLRASFDRLATNPVRSTVDDYEYQIKMFAAIFKSALRDHALHIQNTRTANDISYLCEDFVTEIRRVLAEYRRMYQIINVPTVTDEMRNYYLFGDEFMSHIVDVHTLRIIKKIDSLHDSSLDAARGALTDLIREEKEYKISMNYQTVDASDAVQNRQLVFRYGMLKKYIESDLYIRLNKKRDGFAVQQVYYSLAAGLAMIFATSVAWVFQIKFGNITIPLFFALVVSYMLKDRIKELMRYYFAHKLGNKYFDNKAQIKIQDDAVGTIKEGVDFISDRKTPRVVLDIRSRSSLVEAENRIFEEKILLYRKWVVIDNASLAANNQYPVNGINEILRFHMNRFTQKMDNPQVPVDMLGPDGKVVTVKVQKIYYINMVMQLQYEEEIEYKRFRVVMTRDGILGVEELQ